MRLARVRSGCRRRLRPEVERCRIDLGGIRSGSSTSVRCAAVWSLGAVGWGNGVVVAGRVFGHHEVLTLVLVPTLGGLGAAWLRRRGFTRQSLGLQLPRVERPHNCLSWVLVLLTAAAALVAVGYFLVALVDGAREMRRLRAARVLVGTAFGEELVHRGVLLAVWADTGLRARWVVLANMVGFGVWHIAGAACNGFHWMEVLGPFGLAVPLLWVRLRFRSILVPMAFHAATNLPGVLRVAKPACR